MDDHNQQNLNNKQAKLGVRCVTIFWEDKWYLQGTRQRKNSNGTTMERLHGDYDVH